MAKKKRKESKEKMAKDMVRANKQDDLIIDFDFFDIDKTRLDEELMNQPKMFFKYASLLAKAQRKESEARAAREVIKAEIDLKVRKNLKKYKIHEVKLTEAVIFGVVSKQPKFIKAQKKRLKAKYRTDLLQGAVYALNHRKSSLEGLVKLHGQNYFANPKIDNPEFIEAVNVLIKKAARKRKS